MAQRPNDKNPLENKPTDGPLERKIARARIVMVLEQIWPRLWLPITIAAIFLLVSTYGLWPALPFAAHVALLGVFAVALLASFWPLFKVNLANRHAAIRWLEKKSGLPHRPATVLDDNLANTRDKPANALWEAHKQRAKDHVEAMKTGLPHPRTERFDKYALRVPLVLAMATTIGLLSHRFSPGITEAFEFNKTSSLTDLRIDAWVTPPAYTGTPMVMLVDGGKSVEGQKTANKISLEKGSREHAIKIPEMSELVVRISGLNAQSTTLVLKTPPPAKAVTKIAANAPATQKSTTPKIVVKEDGAVRDLRVKLVHNIDAELYQDSKLLKSWRFVVKPDHPPAIIFTKKPEASPRGSLRLSYRVADDYGVIEANAQISKSALRYDRFGKKIMGVLPPSSPAPNNLTLPLGTPPVIALQLPKGNTKRGNASTYKDLTAHPWAGLEVEAVLVAKDEAGKTGRSPISRFKLPERKFNKPLARAIIAQRRSLAESPIGRRRVAHVLDELTQRSVNADHPDMTTGVYLGLRSAYWRLLHASTRKTIRSVVDQLWEIALTIEDGNLSKAERELRSAQDRLMDALSKNASPQEIAKLMKELRQALDKFLRAMAKDQQNQKQNADQQQMPGNQRTLSSRDLDKMLRDIEKMAKTGAKDAARQMLSQLREMLENLNNSTPQQSARQKQMQKQLENLGKMIMQQRRLLDETHQKSQQRQGQGQRQGRREGQQQGQRSGKGRQPGQQQGQGKGKGQGQNPNGNQQGQGMGNQRQRAGGGGLMQRQGELLDGLNELMDQMGRMGVPVPQDLMRAGSNMGQAESQLGQQQLNSAGRQQGKALENLRKGAGQMAEKMMRNGQGRGQQAGRRNRDPLGRARRTSGPEFGDDVKVPREIDTRRARDILEELRRRLGQSTRPPAELDYLERLIEQF